MNNIKKIINYQLRTGERPKNYERGQQIKEKGEAYKENMKEKELQKEEEEWRCEKEKVKKELGKMQSDMSPKGHAYQAQSALLGARE